jgi:succinate-semialdehyde dehydrogenase/glutarate-semialdehyde dehydrogenase
MSVNYSKLFIDGEWIDPSGKEYFEVHSPVSGKRLAKVPIAVNEDVKRAAEAAKQAQEKWRFTHFTERAKLLHRVANIIEKSIDKFVKELVLEQGKPVKDAKIEIQGCIDYFRGAAEDIKRLETSVIPSIDPNKRVITIREPLGVFGIITPWNFPWDIPCFIIAPALAAGNSIVLKPAEQTPLCGVRIIECLNEAGFPHGVVNLVQGPGEITGEAITSNEHIDAIAFTGSTETGRKIASQAGKTIKHLLLELGGNGPIIVLNDADLSAAIEATSISCFFNAGQVCNSGERILVQDEIHDKFVEGMVRAAAQVKLGDPFSPDVTMGPLIDEALASKVDQHISDAVSLGARIRFGGKRAKGFPTDLYYEPTVLEDVSTNMLINKEETFGPVCPIIRFTQIDEAIKIAESSEYGLMSSVFTKSMKSAFYIAERIKTGTVAINTPSNYWEGRLPWGGMKKSGIGRQGGCYSLYAMTQLKTIIIDLSKS